MHASCNQSCRQVCYDDSVHFQSMAVLLRKTDPGAGYSWPGYVLYMVNVTRVCDNYISGDCIATSGQDSCIADLLDRLLNGTLSSVWRPRAIAGVAVAGVCLSAQLVVVQPDSRSSTSKPRAHVLAYSCAPVLPLRPRATAEPHVPCKSPKVCMLC